MNRPSKHIIIIYHSADFDGIFCREIDIGWARSLRDQCRAGGVQFFMKQLGAAPGAPWKCPNDTDGDGDCHLCHRSGRCLHKPEVRR